VDLFNLLSKEVVASEYKAVKGDGRAFVFIRPKYIAQIEFTDLIMDDSSGESIYRMVLNYDIDGEKWIPKGSAPFLSLISPRFVMMRSENPVMPFENPKEITYPDLRMEQITTRIPIETEKKQMLPISYPPGKIIFRFILEGLWQGKKSAKKIAIIERGETSGAFPRFTVYHVDYGPDRTSPFETSIYPFNSIEKALRMIDSIIWENYINTEVTGLKKSVKFHEKRKLIDESIIEILPKNLTPLIQKVVLGKVVRTAEPEKLPEKTANIVMDAYTDEFTKLFKEQYKGYLKEGEKMSATATKNAKAFIKQDVTANSEKLIKTLMMLLTDDEIEKLKELGAPEPSEESVKTAMKIIIKNVKDIIEKGVDPEIGKIIESIKQYVQGILKTKR
jgi:hypothetical protein